MAIFSQNQVRHLMISNSALADAGEITVVDAKGGSVDAGDALLFRQLLSDGTTQAHEAIALADVKSVTKTVKATAVAGSATFTIDVSAATTGDYHRAEIMLTNWGSTSFEDTYLKHATHMQTATDTDATAALGLVVSLANNFSREEPRSQAKILVPTAGYTTFYALDSDRPASTSGADGTYYYVIETGETFQGDGATNIDSLVAAAVEAADGTAIYDNPLFNFVNGVNGEIYIIAKEQQYVVGKFQDTPLTFDVTATIIDKSDDYNTIPYTVTETHRTLNPCSAKTIQQLEWFANGNKGDQYRGMEYPINFEDDLLSTTGTTYEAIYTIEYVFKGAASYVMESPKTLQLACGSVPGTADSDAAKIEAAISTAWSISL